MVSAGLDTVPGNLIMGIAYLSSPHGQEIQKRAYDEIMKVYPNGDAWENCLTEEKVPYVTALVKEILRFWTVIPICLPRVSITDIQYENATIPAGSTFYMVRLTMYRGRRPRNMLTRYIECMGSRLRRNALQRPQLLPPGAVSRQHRGDGNTSLRLRRRLAHVRRFSPGEPRAVHCLHPTDQRFPHPAAEGQAR